MAPLFEPIWDFKNSREDNELKTVNKSNWKRIDGPNEGQG